MDEAQTKRLAKQAWGVEEHFFATRQLREFAALVRREALEEAAAVCYEAARHVENFDARGFRDTAAAIRALISTPAASGN